MKYVILAFLAVFTPHISFAQATSLETYIFEDGDLVQKVEGFKHQAEWGAATYIKACYRGSVADVCGLVQQEIQNSQQEYEQGTESYLKLTSCKIQKDAANVRYQMFDVLNADPQEKQTQISKCK